MYQPEDDFNLQESLDRLKKPSTEKDNIDDDRDVSPERVQARQQQLEKIFIKLIAFGLGIGLVLGIGVFIALTKLGLTKKPYELEKEQQKPNNSTEQIQFAPHTSKQFQYRNIDRI